MASIELTEAEVKRLQQKADRLRGVLARRQEVAVQLEQLRDELNLRQGILQGAVAELLELRGYPAEVGEAANINLRPDGGIEVSIPDAPPQNRAARRAAVKKKPAPAGCKRTPVLAAEPLPAK